MHSFGTIAAASFRQYSTYRLATAAGVFTNSVFGLIRASILLAAIHAAGGDVAGYSAIQAATYVWLGQAMLAAIEAFGTRDLAQRIHAGDIAVDLLRPVGLLQVLYAQKIGRSAFLILGRGLPPTLIGALVTGIALPSEPLSWLLALPALLLAITVAFLGDTLMNLLAFWLVEVRGLLTLYMIVMNVMSGFLIPLAWFPDWFRIITALTPFPAMVQTPIDVLSGRVTGVDALVAVGIQLVWASVLALVTQRVLAAGVRATEVQGG